jgi:uncharacterized protein YbjT (DUF2867 family)
MTKPRVLIVGATGRTGATVVDALLEAGETVRNSNPKSQGFRIDTASQAVEALVRPASSTKPSVLKLQGRGVKIHVGELEDDAQLAGILAGIDTVISTLGPEAHLKQIPLVDAAKKAGIRRFVPCAWMTVCPPGGIMWIRDQVGLSINHSEFLDLVVNA